MKDLAVVIVNWKVPDLLRACLQALYSQLEGAGLGAEVWVVDNASGDGSVDMVRAEFPQARLIASQENLGFAGGNNLALRRILAQPEPPRHVLLLNPDAEVQPGALRALLDFMDRTPRAGVAGAQLAYGDGRFQHGAFEFPGLWQIVIDLWPVPARLWESRLNGRYPRAWYQADEPFPIGHPLGAAMLVRRQTIQEVGLLDEGFHMYCEEIDWCWRIQRAGWDIYCVPRARVIHHAGQSTAQIRVASFINLWCSRRRLYAKHYRRLKRWLAVALVKAGLAWQKRRVRRRMARGEVVAEQGLAQLEAYQGALSCFEIGFDVNESM